MLVWGPSTLPRVGTRCGPPAGPSGWQRGERAGRRRLPRRRRAQPMSRGPRWATGSAQRGDAALWWRRQVLTAWAVASPAGRGHLGRSALVPRAPHLSGRAGASPVVASFPTTLYSRDVNFAGVGLTCRPTRQGKRFAGNKKSSRNVSFLDSASVRVVIRRAPSAVTGFIELARS